MGRRRIGLRELLAQGPVLSARARGQWLEEGGPSGVAYASAPVGAHPLLPLQVFGAAYALDLVVVDDHPDWDMHELALLQTPEGPVWLCKDSRVDTLEQSLTADFEGLESWLPEVPLRRHRAPVEVTDRSDARWLDLDLAYTNPDGDRVRIHYTGRRPRAALRQRNSSTMGHSAGQVLAALDVSSRAMARSATVDIAGERRPLVRILGLVPFAVALVQVQAGLSVGRWTQRDAGDAVCTEHLLGERTVAQRWRVERVDGGCDLIQEHPARTLRFAFRGPPEALELERVDVENFGHHAPVASLHLVPRLPDARRRFEGAWEGRWILDVGGQPSHATGRVLAAWEGEVLRLQVRPTAPRWTLDRPLDVRLRPGPEGAEARVERVAVEG